MTNKASHLENISHDKINYYLKNEKLTPRLLWDNVKDLIVVDEDAYIIFDDTVIDKRFSEEIEIVRRQYSGNEHGVVRGIGIVNCIYVNPKTLQCRGNRLMSLRDTLSRTLRVNAIVFSTQKMMV